MEKIVFVKGSVCVGGNRWESFEDFYVVSDLVTVFDLMEMLTVDGVDVECIIDNETGNCLYHAHAFKAVVHAGEYDPILMYVKPGTSWKAFFKMVKLQCSLIPGSFAEIFAWNRNDWKPCRICGGCPVFADYDENGNEIF